jgi:hypothetical protein
MYKNRFFLIVLTIIAVTFGAPSCSEDNGTDWSKVVGGLLLTPKDAILLVGDDLQLAAQVFPNAAPDKSVAWTSDNASVATVDANGLVKAVGAGAANITAASVSNSAVTRTCAVTVLSSLTVSLNVNTLYRIPVGAERQLTTTVSPTSVSQNVTWSSSNPGVATVEGGVVKAVGVGTATITATSVINEGSKAECTVSVVNASLPTREWLSGLWTFDDESNSCKAAVGYDLERQERNLAPLAKDYAFVDGPTAGDKAVVVPRFQQYACKHGITPGGGTARVNEYTLLVDFYVPRERVQDYCSFLQTDPANNNDAEIFINRDAGIGISGFYSRPAVQPRTWHRYVLTIKCNEFYKQYLDGELLSETGAVGGNLAVDARFSLDPSSVILFGDEDGEDFDLHVAAAAFWNKALSAEEVASLGRTDTPIK